MRTILENVDISKPLAQQKKPDFVCEPGDPRVRKFGWTKSKFRVYLSILPEEKTIFISAVWSINRGKGNFSKLVKNIQKAGYTIKVPSPFPNMESICKHLGFRRTLELFPEVGENILVMVLDRKK